VWESYGYLLLGDETSITNSHPKADRLQLRLARWKHDHTAVNFAITPLTRTNQATERFITAPTPTDGSRVMSPRTRNCEIRGATGTCRRSPMSHQPGPEPPPISGLGHSGDVPASVEFEN
jgi:hypothetical protein